MSAKTLVKFMVRATIIYVVICLLCGWPIINDWTLALVLLWCFSIFVYAGDEGIFSFYKDSKHAATIHNTILPAVLAGLLFVGAGLMSHYRGVYADPRSGVYHTNARCNAIQTDQHAIPIIYAERIGLSECKHCDDEFYDPHDGPDTSIDLDWNYHEKWWELYGILIDEGYRKNFDDFLLDLADHKQRYDIYNHLVDDGLLSMSFDEFSESVGVRRSILGFSYEELLTLD